mmetsp:Transcript_25851/g.79565  ORF Transcript_25851/g.79565 Transcript_25851/m.79565 type:complete len:356 (+) Transcript_25851:60-1127(+)
MELVTTAATLGGFVDKTALGRVEATCRCGETLEAAWAFECRRLWATTTKRGRWRRTLQWLEESDLETVMAFVADPAETLRALTRRSFAYRRCAASYATQSASREVCRALAAKLGADLFHEDDDELSALRRLVVAFPFLPAQSSRDVRGADRLLDELSKAHAARRQSERAGAVYVLWYGIALLNTDLHSGLAKTTEDGFARSLQPNVSDGTARAVYRSVKLRPLLGGDDVPLRFTVSHVRPAPRREFAAAIRANFYYLLFVRSVAAGTWPVAVGVANGVAFVLAHVALLAGSPLLMATALSTTLVAMPPHWERWWSIPALTLVTPLVLTYLGLPFFAFYLAYVAVTAPIWIPWLFS